MALVGTVACVAAIALAGAAIAPILFVAGLALVLLQN